MPGVTGDFSKLLSFAKRVGNLAGQNALTAVSSACADATLELIDEGFEQERDPTGRPWESKLFPNGRGVLEQSGKLRRSFGKRQVNSNGFTVSSDDPKFHFHQRGTGIFGPKHKRIRPKRAGVLAWPVAGGMAFAASVDGVPIRRMLPENGKVPRAWQTRWKKRAEQILKETFSGARAASRR